MSASSPEFHESLCQRFLLVQEASGLSKAKFAALAGMSPQQFTHIVNYRTTPSHEAIMLICECFSLPADWFYFGRFSHANRNPKMTRMLQVASLYSPSPAT